MNKYYTADILRNGKSPQSVWVAETPKGTAVQNVSRWEEKEEPPKEMFVRGEGWINLKKNNIPKRVSDTKQILTYQDVYDLIELHGFVVAKHILGFGDGSVGHAWPIASLIQFKEYKMQAVEWFEGIAMLDHEILEALKKLGFEMDDYNPFNCAPSLNNGEDNHKYEFVYAPSPFVGQHIESCLKGFPIPATIDVVRWSKSIRAVLDLKPKIKRPVSDHQMLAEITTKDTADWMLNNIAIPPFYEKKQALEKHPANPKPWEKENNNETA